MTLGLVPHSIMAHEPWTGEMPPPPLQTYSVGIRAGT